MRVQGEGHPSAVLAFVTDTPTALPELDPFLNDEDLPIREWLFLTNLVSPDDWPELEMELNFIVPEVIITLGPVVTRAFMGEVDMERAYGHPYQVGCFVVFPAHAPINEVEFACDMLRLSLYIQGDLPPTPPPSETPAQPAVPTPARHQPRLDL